MRPIADTLLRRKTVSRITESVAASSELSARAAPQWPGNGAKGATCGPAATQFRDGTHFHLGDCIGMSQNSGDPTPTATDDQSHEHGHWGSHDHAAGMFGHIHDMDDDFF